MISTSEYDSFNLLNLSCLFVVGSIHPNKALMPFSVTEGSTDKAVFLVNFTFLPRFPSTMLSAISRRKPSHTTTAVLFVPANALATMSF